MDVLADILAHAGVRGVLGARIEGGGDWGWWSAKNAIPGAAFHAVTSGTAWLAVPGEAPRELVPGDLVLFPRGDAHAIGSDAAAVARTSATVFDGYEVAGEGVIRIGHGATRTHVLCAHYVHDADASTEVLTLLPDVVHLHAEPGSRLDDTIRLLGRELTQPELASERVLASLVDILLVQFLRAWLDGREEGGDGVACWLAGLRDPIVGAAIARIHAEPAAPWTTATLADAIAVSRATLSRRFPAVIGETPGAYLTRWRMDLAARRLRDSDASLEAIAQGVGYTSVYAFSRAFSRQRAVPPGRFRTQARAALAA